MTTKKAWSNFKTIFNNKQWPIKVGQEHLNWTQKNALNLVQTLPWLKKSHSPSSCNLSLLYLYLKLICYVCDQCHSWHLVMVTWFEMVPWYTIVPLILIKTPWQIIILASCILFIHTVELWSKIYYVPKNLTRRLAERMLQMCMIRFLEFISMNLEKSAVVTFQVSFMELPLISFNAEWFLYKPWRPTGLF